MIHNCYMTTRGRYCLNISIKSHNCCRMLSFRWDWTLFSNSSSQRLFSPHSHVRLPAEVVPVRPGQAVVVEFVVKARKLSWELVINFFRYDNLNGRENFLNTLGSCYPVRGITRPPLAWFVIRPYSLTGVLVIRRKWPDNEYKMFLL